MNKYRIKRCLSDHGDEAWFIQKRFLLIFWYQVGNYCWTRKEDAISKIEFLNQEEV